MRCLICFIFMLSSFGTLAQKSAPVLFTKDSLLVIAKDPVKGFHSDYLLFIPKGTALDKTIFLLVEPNNTGRTCDSIEVHREHAIQLAAVNSIGNNVANWYKIPLLVPVFPRPAARPLLYTHALDRDVMLEPSAEFKRLDLQLLEMIEDARKVLAQLHIIVDSKILMNGFSASASFTNRFSFLHPEKIRALAIGGFNGELMLAQTDFGGVAIGYPIGINDYQELFGKSFDPSAYNAIAQFIYMGARDDNDAVQFDDAYNAAERETINQKIGNTVARRYARCQNSYRRRHPNAIFKSYPEVGHWTTREMNLEIIGFFGKQMQQR